MRFSLRAKRILTGAAAGALVLSMLPAGVASADMHEEVCADAPDSGHEDKGTTHADSIDCVVAYGIAQGKTADVFGTFDNLTRGQAATFFLNFGTTADADLAVDTDADTPFTDVDGTTHDDSIRAIYDLGWIDGTTATTYSPNESITRGQFAKILFEAHVALGVEFDASYDEAFPDAGDTFGDEINALAGEGIIDGYVDGTFGTWDNVLRGQTASLFAESAGFLDNLGLWDADRLGQPDTNQTFTVTGDGDGLLEHGDIRQFTASGITSDTVDIALIDSDGVTVDAGGSATFEGTNPGGTGNAADWTLAASDVTVLNGASVTATNYVNDADSADGTVTFTVTADDADDSFVVVVFDDADNDNVFELDANGEPTNDFGVSSENIVILPEAADNLAVTGPVTVVDLENDFFGNGTNTFFYDSNDEYILAGTPDSALTMAEFEARLSVGDGISGNYRVDAANQSSFTLDDVAPVAPTGVDTRAPSGDDAGEQGIEVFWTESSTETAASYDVYRAEATQPTITGGAITCPDTDDFTVVGSVDDENLGTAAGAEHKFVDNNVALESPAGSGDPTYCYFVVAVDATGDTGPESTVVSDTAYVGDTSAEPVFVSASAEAGTSTVVVNYDEDIQGATVDSNGSNYEVTLTRGGVTYALTETGAAIVGTDSVSITVSHAQLPFQSGDTVVVTAAQGDDGDTVLDTTDVAQPVGDAVQTTAGDTTAPVITATNPAAGATTVTFTSNEELDAATVSAADFTDTSAANLASAVLEADGVTITVTFDAGLTAADEITLTADSVEDLAGNTGPAAPVTAVTTA